MTANQTPKASAGNRIKDKYDSVVLVLQGGGALGAYQAGCYQALYEADIHINWVAGISIGAINAALIAGNDRDNRVKALRTFWERVTTPNVGLMDPNLFSPWIGAGLQGRGLINQMASMQAMTQGQPGFFTPRIPPPQFQPSGSPEARSFYDTSPLRETLAELTDFDRINRKAVRLSVGAVNVRTGNFVFFDNAARDMAPEHIMASGALPPGFPPVKIDGESYWDGGLVSNTPLNYIIETEPSLSALVFQVDVWSARGEFPADLAAVIERQKDITFSSRTRMNTDVFSYVQKLRQQIRALLDKLPQSEREMAEAKALEHLASHGSMNIIHLIYRKKSHETHSKDYNFSRASMEEHWSAGYNDTVRTLRHPAWLEPPSGDRGVVTHDIHRHGQD
jgi:NTE family protein